MNKFISDDLIKTKIALCMSRFDVDRVQEMMEKVNWKWAGTDGKEQVPTTYNISHTAQRLLWDAAHSESLYRGTGGLVAEWTEKDDELNCTLELVFEEADSCHECDSFE